MQVHQMPMQPQVGLYLTLLSSFFPFLILLLNGPVSPLNVSLLTIIITHTLIPSILPNPLHGQHHTPLVPLPFRPWTLLLSSGPYYILLYLWHEAAATFPFHQPSF